MPPLRRAPSANVGPVSTRRWVGRALGAIVVIGAVIANAVTCGGQTPSQRTAHMDLGGNESAFGEHAGEREPADGSHRLEGQVIDDEQQPVAGVVVQISPGNLRVTSEADGSFAVDHLLPRWYQLSARWGVRFQLGNREHAYVRESLLGSALTRSRSWSRQPRRQNPT